MPEPRDHAGLREAIARTICCPDDAMKCIALAHISLDCYAYDLDTMHMADAILSLLDRVGKLCPHEPTDEMCRKAHSTVPLCEIIDPDVELNATCAELTADLLRDGIAASPYARKEPPRE